MSIVDLLEEHEGESLTVVSDRASGLRAIIAIHSTRLGPPFGGVRTLGYRSSTSAATDALRLAQQMSYKAAAAGLPIGGGKCVVFNHDGMDRKEAFLELGRRIERLGGILYVGLDVGTTPDDLELVGSQTSAAAPLFDFGRAGAKGVAAAIRAGLKQVFGDESPVGRKIAIQGVGKIGSNLAKMLCAEGADVVVADVDNSKAELVSRESGCEVTAASRIASVECDVFSPCGLGGVLTERSISRLRCSMVAGAANNQLATPRAGAALHEAGILYVPDFVANVGSLTMGYYRSKDPAFEDYSVIDRVFDSAAAVLERAAAEDRPTADVAVEIARERIFGTG